MAGDGLSPSRPLHLPAGGHDFPKHWSWARLDDACEGVFDCPHSTPDLTETGPLVVRSQDIITGIFRSEEAAHVSEDTYRERTSKATPSRGDLLYSREGTYFGIAAEVPEHMRICLGQRMVLIRPRTSALDFRFLRHWLNSPIMASHIHGYRDGSVAERLNLPTIRALPVAIPPIEEQRSIARVLGALDNKVELNRRMNETLESIARALFKSWFVDFDPVHAKADGRIPGLPAPIADLFPDAFGHSELGEVPKGWVVTPLEELVETVKGRSYKSEELVESAAALVTLKSFARGGGYRPDGLKSFAGTYKPDQVIRPGELVIACTDVTQAAEVIGRSAIVRGTSAYETLIASLDTMIVRPRNSDMTRAFLYYLGTTRAFVAHTYAHTTGTTVLHLAKGAIPSFAFARPPTQLVYQFDRLANAILDRVQILADESDTLTALRNTILPKLMSGQLRLRDAARLVETVE